MAIFLCLDSALGAGSVALVRDGQCIAFEPIMEKGAQARLLVPMIHSCLDQQQLQPADVTEIYCTVGPGGFTGIRIALSSAQALGFTLGIPVVGVSTLACIAADAALLLETPDASCITAILPAGRGQVYAQSFSPPQLQPLNAAGMRDVGTLSAQQGLVVCPQNVVIHDLSITPLFTCPMDARSVARLIASSGFHRFHALPADALYIRPPDATLPKLN